MEIRIVSVLLKYCGGFQMTAIHVLEGCQALCTHPQYAHDMSLVMFGWMIDFTIRSPFNSNCPFIIYSPGNDWCFVCLIAPPRSGGSLLTICEACKSFQHFVSCMTWIFKGYFHFFSFYFKIWISNDWYILNFDWKFNSLGKKIMFSLKTLLNII